MDDVPVTDLVDALGEAVEAGTATVAVEYPEGRIACYYASGCYCGSIGLVGDVEFRRGEAD